MQRRGGKVLMYFGWADPALNAQMGVDYYESVLEKMGAGTPNFFRLFMVPGMFHCGGGVGCSNFDKLTPLMQWVEQGAAPESMLACSTNCFSAASAGSNFVPVFFCIARNIASRSSSDSG